MSAGIPSITKERLNNARAYVHDLYSGKLEPGAYVVYSNGTMQFSGRDREEVKAVVSEFPEGTLFGQVSFRVAQKKVEVSNVLPFIPTETTQANYFP